MIVMLYEHGQLNATLAAAAGDDPALIAELRAAYHSSLSNHIDLLTRARCDGNWNVAALRLKGLAASFHSSELIVLAEEALDSAPGDPAILRKLELYQIDFANSGD